MQVKGNTKCYLSERGYYNFMYPKKDTWVLIRDDCDVEKLAWIGSDHQSLIPVKIKLSNLLINKISEYFMPNKSHTVVWIENNIAS